MEKKLSAIEGLKTIYDEADKQGAFDPIKEKLFKKAVDKKQNNNDTESSANVSSETNTNKKNVDFSAGGFKPDFTDIANYNPNVNLAQRFGGDTNVNIEGKKQLNKYLDLKGFADSDGDYGASVGFDFKF